MKNSTKALGLGALVVMIMACGNPAGGSNSGNISSTGSNTGSIAGKATLAGQSDNSSITVTADSVSSKGLTPSVQNAIASRSPGSRSIAATASANASGAYTLSGLAPGNYTVYASCDSSLEKAVSTVVTVTAGKTVSASDMNLTPTGSITGTATLNGAATGNLGIVVYIAGTSYEAMTSDSGAFTISSVPVNSGYTLVASMNGYSSSITTVSVAGGTATAAGTLNLAPSAAPSSTTGSITGTAQVNGTASPGVFVYLSGTSYIAMSGTNGGFSITGVAPGTYTVVASMTGYNNATSNAIAVSAGSASALGILNVTTPSPTSGSVTGIAELNGYLDAGITICLSGTSYSTVSGTGGAFTIKGVAPGTYTAVASLPGCINATSSSLSVGAGTSASAGTLNVAWLATVPLGLNAVAGSNQVSLSWTPVNGATGYNLYKSTSSGVTKANGTKILVLTNQYTDANCSNGTIYYYVVTAMISIIESNASTQATGYTWGAPGPANGLVFYDAGSQQSWGRYLEAAPSDQSAGVQWYNGSNVITGATLTAIGTGKVNTAQIIRVQGSGTYAASLCSNFFNSGYEDWFLPSKDELNALYSNLCCNNLGSLGNLVDYWSSSEATTSGASMAWCQLFSSGAQGSMNKNGISSMPVRAIRAF